MKVSTTIIIPAFNRPKSLQRLLDSLENAIYPKHSIKLLISIDYEDSKARQQVCHLAEHFNWKYGEKIVQQQSINLGLKQHILTCGDLTEQYEQIILLEDDLYVSPHFYSYTSAALNYYQTEKKIAGISLYSYEICESLRLPFRPIHDDSDVYFLQVPSSWGQAWNLSQWQGFREWLITISEEKVNQLLYPYVRHWHRTKSWKRYFMAYLIDEECYFVYPRQSLSTNFSDPGTNKHRTDNNHLYQVNLLRASKSFQFKSLAESCAIYDSFFEISALALQQLNPVLQAYEFEVDLKGGKEQKDFRKPYVLTTKNGQNPLLAFDNRLRPLENNIIFKQTGHEIQLFRQADIKEKTYIKSYNFKSFQYLDYHLYNAHSLEHTFFKLLNLKYIWIVLKSKLIDKLKRKDR